MALALWPMAIRRARSTLFKYEHSFDGKSHH